MATRTISLKDAAERYRQLGRRFWPTVLQGARLGGERVRALMVERSKPVLDRGGYARGWKTSVTERSVVVYNQAPYAGVIEKGRRPGRQPPTKALVPWVRRKLGVSTKEAKSVAFLVARKIAQEGTPGKYILLRATGAIMKLLQAEIGDALRRALAR